MEILFVVIVGIIHSIHGNPKADYLFDFDHGLLIFILGIIAFVIDCCYLKLFPNFSLPLNVNPRKKWGLAMAGELIQMQKLFISAEFEETKYKLQKYSIEYWDEPCDKGDFKETNKYPITYGTIALAYGHDSLTTMIEARCSKKHLIFSNNSQLAREVVDKCVFFDDPDIDPNWKKARDGTLDLKQLDLTGLQTEYKQNEECPITLAVLAMANDKWDTVEWLEKNGAEKHLMFNNDSFLARQRLEHVCGKTVVLKPNR